jgi:glycosyltransferase involved in cell wall biosynthesis
LQAILHAHGFVPRSVLVRNVPWKNDALIRDRSRLQQFGIPAGANVAVYLGGLQSGRGLETIILSIESISSIDVHLLLIGDGALRAALEQQTNNLHLAERVHFAGAIASDDALQIAAACDAGLAIVEPISKSYELALPSKLFEYMMAGLPVVINTMRHVHELFGEQPWLIQVNPSDVNSIANGIERAIARSKDSAITQEEQRIALDRYHFEADAASLIAQIEQHLALST